MHELGFDHGHMSPEDQQAIADTIWAADNVELVTVGVDVGSSTSHLMFAKVHLQRLTTALSSRFVVVNREVLWRSPILLTPYLSDNTIDVGFLQKFIEEGYKEAGLKRSDIDSGAVILTGEALKRKNAEAITHLFAEESGKFVCASAGHHLECAMAAHGSGAIALSVAAQTGANLLDELGEAQRDSLRHHDLLQVVERGDRRRDPGDCRGNRGQAAHELDRLVDRRVPHARSGRNREFVLIVTVVRLHLGVAEDRPSIGDLPPRRRVKNAVVVCVAPVEHLMDNLAEVELRLLRGRVVVDVVSPVASTTLPVGHDVTGHTEPALNRRSAGRGSCRCGR